MTTMRDRCESAMSKDPEISSSNPWGVLRAVPENVDLPTMFLRLNQHELGCAVDDREFLIEKPGISQKHCSIARKKADDSQGFSTFITDLSSSGTDLNGQRLIKHAQTLLHHGDRVKLYHTSGVLEFIYLDWKKRKAEEIIRIRERLPVGGTVSNEAAQDMQARKQEECNVLTEIKQKKFDNAKNAKNEEHLRLLAFLENERNARHGSEEKVQALERAIFKQRNAYTHLRQELEKIKDRIEELLGADERRTDSLNAAVGNLMIERTALKEIQVHTLESMMNRGKEDVIENHPGPSRYRGTSNSVPSEVRARLNSRQPITSGGAKKEESLAPVDLLANESMPEFADDTNERHGGSAELLAREILEDDDDEDDATAGVEGESQDAAELEAGTEGEEKDRGEVNEVMPEGDSSVEGISRGEVVYKQDSRLRVIGEMSEQEEGAVMEHDTPEGVVITKSMPRARRWELSASRAVKKARVLTGKVKLEAGVFDDFSKRLDANSNRIERLEKAIVALVEHLHATLEGNTDKQEVKALREENAKLKTQVEKLKVIIHNMTT